MIELAPGTHVYGGYRPQHSSFSDTAEAAAYLHRRVSSRWSIRRILQNEINVELLGTGYSAKVRLTTGGRLVEFPRSSGNQDGGVSLSAKGEVIDTLNAQVGSYDDNRIFERGLLWVDVHQGQLQTLHVNLLPEHGLDESGISEQLDNAFEKGVHFVDGLIKGQPVPEFSA